jgi:hypothetical protein
VKASGRDEGIGGFQLKDFVGDSGEVREDEIVVDGADPGRFKEERSATYASGRFGILPFVANDKGPIHIELPFEPRFGKQTRLRFPAGTTIRFIMRADENVIDRQGAPEEIVHAIHFTAEQVTAGDSRLVGGDDDGEPGSLELFQHGRRAVVDLEFFERDGADLMLPVHAHLVQDAIAFNKNSKFHISREKA